MATLKEYFLATLLMGVCTTVLFAFMILEIAAIFLLTVGGAMALFSIGIYILLFTIGGPMALFATGICIYRSYRRGPQLVPAQEAAARAPPSADEAARAPGGGEGDGGESSGVGIGGSSELVDAHVAVVGALVCTFLSIFLLAAVQQIVRLCMAI